MSLLLVGFHVARFSKNTSGVFSTSVSRDKSVVPVLPAVLIFENHLTYQISI